MLSAVAALTLAAVPPRWDHGALDPEPQATLGNGGHMETNVSLAQTHTEPHFRHKVEPKIATRLMKESLSGKPFRFASSLGHNMVLAAAPKKAMIWGFTPYADDKVTVNFGSHQIHATIEPDHATQALTTWRVLLPETEQGFEAHDITVTSREVPEYNLTLSGVMFGEVWFCSGQSNMVYPLVDHGADKNCWNRNAPKYWGCVADAQTEVRRMHLYDDSIRLFQTYPKSSDVPMAEAVVTPNPHSTGDTAWYKPSETSGDFSSVCWFYARDLYTALSPKRPIGVIMSAVGGTNIEMWSSPRSMSDNCGVSHAPKGDDSTLWNALVVPLLRTTITGAIWYQGEANQEYPKRYECVFPAMIEDWRAQWHTRSDGQTSADFPFGWAQLNADNAPSEGVEPGMAIKVPFKECTLRIPGATPAKECGDCGDCVGSLHEWADGISGLRLAQENALKKVDNGFMIATFDTPGNNIHSPYKQPVGRRFARAALATAYNQPKYHLDPTVKSVQLHGGGVGPKHILISVGGVGPNGLRVTDGAPGFQVLGQCDGEENSTMKVGRMDMCWTPVQIASHDSTTVTLTELPVQPEAVRYGWSAMPFGRGLYPKASAPIFVKPEPFPGGAYSGSYYGEMGNDWIPLRQFILPVGK